VATLKMRGVDFIKVHNGISREAFLALAEEAKKYGLLLAVHPPRIMPTAEVSDAGAKSLEHIETLVESTIYRPNATAKTIDQAFAELSGDAATALFKKLAANGTWYDPTLVAYERGFVLWSNKPEALAPRRKVHEGQIGLVTAMHKAGVRLLAGSDFSDWALIPGVDLHNELALFVLAGLTPMEALQTATSGPAEFLGRSAYLGTIEPGRFADLVLLDMDPIEDISHTRKINSVVVRGKLIRVKELRERMLNGPNR
jgi:imidazolonepropionase-like amidohydrolase